MLRRIAFVALAPAIAVACNPSDCQGAGFVTDQEAVVFDDVANLFELCPGNDVEFIGDVNVTSQAQLDQVAGCEKIIGNLTILNSTDIVDLGALAALEQIDEGYFLALNNAALTSVDLAGITKVAYGIGVIDNPLVTNVVFNGIVQSEGDINIRNNAALTNVSFQNLEDMLADNRGGPGNLIIGENPLFAGFDNFPKLETIDGFFSVFKNDALPNFEGLELLTNINNSGNAAQALAVGIDFDEEGNIIDAGNANLENMQGLNELDTINGDVFIGFNPELNSLEGLDDLRVHAKNIFIVGNDSLPNLTGFNGDGGADDDDDGLQTVGGSLFVGVFFDKFKNPVAAGNDVLVDLNGLDNLTTLTGSLVLGFNGQLADLEGLDVLTTIGGDLVIVGSNALDSFNGAPALTTVNGNLFLGQIFGADEKVLNPVLDVEDQPFDTGIAIPLDLVGDNGFEALTTVNKDLVVAFSDTETLRIANTLTTITGRFILHGSDLQNLTGFETVTALGGLVVGMAVDKLGNFSPSNNNNFEAFTGLGVATLGAGGLAIGFNDDLVNLATLAGTVTNVVGSVTIAGQDFTNLQGFDVTDIGGDLNIGAVRNGNNEPLDFGMDNLTALDLNELDTVGGDVLIAFNDDLVDTTLTVLGTVGGAFEITDCDTLQNIAGLVALTSVGDLRVHDLEALQTMAMPALAAVTNDLFLVRNPDLATIDLAVLGNVGGDVAISFINVDNLNGITALAAVAGDVTVSDNVELDNIAAWDNLATVGGDLTFARNAAVQDFALTGLTTVTGSLTILGMGGLQDLEGLEALTTVGDALRLQDNENLATVRGLEALGTIGRTLSLVNNAELETLLIDANNDDIEDVGDEGLLVLAVLGDPDFEGFGGDRGVVEAQNNPLLDEGEIDDVVDDLDGVFAGLFVLCGNENSAAACGFDPFEGQGAGEGEGEGE